MTDPEPCMTASDLIAYSTGRLASSDSSRIAVHVERCPRCQTALEKIAGAPTAAHEVARVEKPPFLGPPLEAGDLGSIDHYRVVDLLGQGGMGSVFKGIDTVLQRSVAIKVLKELTVPFAKERMLREAQVTAGVVDHRSDLFSLGCVMYRMVTGGLAFPGKSFAAVIAKLATFDPPPVIDQEPDVPHALSDLIGQLLAKKPEQRPGSAADVVERLGALKTEPAWPGPVVLDAGRTTVRARVPRRAKAPWQPWILGAGTLLALAIIGGLASQFVPVAPRLPGKTAPTADAIDNALAAGQASNNGRGERQRAGTVLLTILFVRLR